MGRAFPGNLACCLEGSVSVLHNSITPAPCAVCAQTPTSVTFAYPVCWYLKETGCREQNLNFSRNFSRLIYLAKLKALHNLLTVSERLLVKTLLSF